MGSEQMDARGALILRRKDEIRQQILAETKGEVPTASFLRPGTKEPAFNVDEIPESDWEVLIEAEAGSLSDERMKLYEEDTARAYKQFSDVAKGRGEQVDPMKFGRFGFRAFVRGRKMAASRPRVQ